MNAKTIRSDEKAKFLHYQNGVAYYTVSVPYSEMLYSFPVPLKEIDNEVLEAEGKSISFMKFIRKAIHEGTLRKVAHQL